MKPTIRDVRRCYSKIKQLARTAISERDYNRAAGELALSARIAYLFNWIYSDPETDDMIRRIGRALFDEKSPEPRQTARYAMYNSFGRENRGLTQQYIRALRALQVEFLYIFEDRSKAMAGVESDLAACGRPSRNLRNNPVAPPDEAGGTVAPETARVRPAGPAGTDSALVGHAAYRFFRFAGNREI